MFEESYMRCGYEVAGSGDCESVYHWQRVSVNNTIMDVDSTYKNTTGKVHCVCVHVLHPKISSWTKYLKFSIFCCTTFVLDSIRKEVSQVSHVGCENLCNMSS